MSSLASIVSSDGPIRQGDPDSDDVRTLQLALSQAGYRVGQDGAFGPRTAMVVKQFQNQHGLKADGVVGPLTAALLDAPHETLVATAAPMVVSPDGLHTPAVLVPATIKVWPHDDTASLLAFYGKPWLDGSLVALVDCPWTLFYDGKAWAHPIPFHKKGADALRAVFNEIRIAAGKDDQSSLLKHVRNYSGSGNYRPVRGSSRLSTHAFWAAIDYDAEHLPLAHGVPTSEMPEQVVAAFLRQGFFWGGSYIGRKDPMHFQLAHE